VSGCSTLELSLRLLPVDFLCFSFFFSFASAASAIRLRYAARAADKSAVGAWMDDERDEDDDDAGDDAT